MVNNILEPDKIITGEHLYSEAIGLVLQRAQQKLCIFDQDLSHGSFYSLEKFNLLREFLSGNIASEVTIILRDASFFHNRCPRLIDLLEIYGHKMRVRVTNTSVRHAKDCFILADDMHYIKRIHIDQARFRYAFDAASEVEALNNRFNELMEATEEMTTLRPLGL